MWQISYPLPMVQVLIVINFTSFSVFHTEVNSEYWSQECTQNGTIHSIELDVYAEKQSDSNLSFILSQLKKGRKLNIDDVTTSVHHYNYDFYQ